MSGRSDGKQPMQSEADYLRQQLAAMTERAEAAEADWQAVESVNRKGDEVIVDLTLKLDRLVEVLKVTAGNIRSLGPAGQLPEPYRPWLQAVESAIEQAACSANLEPIQ